MGDFDKVGLPFYERRWFQGSVAVVGLVTAVWAFSGAPKPAQLVSEVFGSHVKVTLSNTEIILDASKATEARFGSGNKLKAAARAVSQYALPLKDEGIALRRAGGSCAEEPELLVPFGADHGETVGEAARAQRPAGRSNVALAVRAAISEFQQAQYKEPNTSERILIFMSGEDECTRNPGVEIRDALQSSEVDTVFRLVALRPSHDQMQRLNAFRHQLTDFARVEISAPRTKRELNHVVKHEVRRAKADNAGTERAASRSEPGSGEGGGGSSGEASGSQSGKAGGEGSAGRPQGKVGTPEWQQQQGKKEEGKGEGEGGKGGAEEDCPPESIPGEAAAGETGEAGSAGEKPESTGREAAESECDETEKEKAERKEKEEEAEAGETTTPGKKDETPEARSLTEGEGEG